MRKRISTASARKRRESSAMFFMGLTILVSANILMAPCLAVKGEVPFSRSREEEWRRSHNGPCNQA